MDARFFLALSFCTLLMAGCAAPATDLLTADEAIALALPRSDRAALVGVYGVEGPQLVPAAPLGDRLALQDDGVPDGALGDGRLSSWVVAYIQDDRFYERRVHADGRMDEAVGSDLPAFTIDERVYAATSVHVDSPVAAQAMRRDECMDGFADDETGYLYSYSLYDELAGDSHAWLQRFFDDETLIDLAEVGLADQSDTWSLVAVDASPGSEHPLVITRLAAEGEVRSTLDEDGRRICEQRTPLQAIVRYSYSTWEDEGPVDLPFHAAFEVGPRVVHVLGSAGAQTYSPLNLFDAILRITDGGGNVVHEEQSWRYSFLDLAHPVGGQWTLDVESANLLPDTSHVDVTLVAYERPGP